MLKRYRVRLLIAPDARYTGGWQTVEVDVEATDKAHAGNLAPTASGIQGTFGFIVAAIDEVVPAS